MRSTMKSSQLTWEKLFESTPEPLNNETLNKLLTLVISNISSRECNLPEDTKPKDDMQFDFVDSMENEEIKIFKYLQEKIRAITGGFEGLPEIDEKYLTQHGFNTKIFNPSKEDLIKILSLGTAELTNIFCENSQDVSPFILKTISFMRNMTNLLQEHVGQSSIFSGENHGLQYESRIYLNTPCSQVGVDFLSAFAQKCIERNIPFEMKGLDKGPGNPQKDRTVLYSNTQFFLQHIEVLEELASEHPDWISQFGTPVHIGGQPNLDSKTINGGRGWYSFGYTPTDPNNGKRMTVTYNDFIDSALRIGLTSAICSFMSDSTKSSLLDGFNRFSAVPLSKEDWNTVINRMSELSSTQNCAIVGRTNHSLIKIGARNISEEELADFILRKYNKDFLENLSTVFPEGSKERELLLNAFRERTLKVTERAQGKKSKSICFSSKMVENLENEKTIEEEYVPRHGKKESEVRVLFSKEFHRPKTAENNSRMHYASEDLDK